MDANLERKLELDFNNLDYCFLPISTIKKIIHKICEEMPFIQEAFLMEEKTITGLLDYVQLEVSFKAVNSLLVGIDLTKLPEGFSIVDSLWTDEELCAWITNYYTLPDDEIEKHKTLLKKKMEAANQMLRGAVLKEQGSSANQDTPPQEGKQVSLW